MRLIQKLMAWANPPKERRTIIPAKLCFTNLPKAKTKPVWFHGNMKAASWDFVLGLSALDSVRDRAGAIFNTMDEAGAVLPTVTDDGGTIKMEYEDDGRYATFLLDPNQTRFSLGGPDENWTGTGLEATTKALGLWVTMGVPWTL